MSNEITISKDLLASIAMNDKTPRYGYSAGKRDRDRNGNRADGGGRWKTPLEIVMDLLGAEFSDEYQKEHERRKNASTPHNQPLNPHN